MMANAPTFQAHGAKAPPFLLLATLSFWGWQSGFFPAGVGMGIVLESARFIKLRWDLTGEDFRRIWNFCMLLALALAVYVLTTNEEGGGLTSMIHSSAAAAARNVSLSGATFLRWLPMTFFLFVAAQTFSESGTVPLSAISVFFRRRRRAGRVQERNVDVSYPYFIVGLFSAGIHANVGEHSYFWGQVVLIAWALWPLRSPRFGIGIWLAALVAVIGLGYSSQHGLGELQRVLEGYNAQWMSGFLRQRTDPSQTMTAIGRIGKLKLSPRIVIRLRPANGGRPPDYLREASYRSYHPQGQTWYSGNGRKDFTDVGHEPGNDFTWTLLPGRTNTSAVNIAAYLEGRSKDTGDPEGLLPLPTGSSRLEKLAVFSLKMNKTGATMASGLGLVIFDALYGPGTTFDSPPDASTNCLDLTVPTNEVPALDRVIAEMKVAGLNEKQKRLAIRQFFSAKFNYSSWLGLDTLRHTNGTALSHFLLESRKGHCEYFATATVLLLPELAAGA